MAPKKSSKKSRKQTGQRGAASTAGGAVAVATREAPSEPERTVLLEVDETIATITLNRPERRNAISPAMMDELEQALDVCEKGPAARVVILTGAGPAFSGGMDITALLDGADKPPKQHLADARRLARLFKKIYAFPLPTIAAVNGPAIAGGCGLATLCDFTLASPSATFGYPEVNIGFIPAMVSVFLWRQVGDRRVRELLLGGQVISAREAYRIGLISEVVADGHKLMLRAYDVAASLVSHSPTALGRMKALLQQLMGLDVDEALEAAARASVDQRQTEDYREGLRAFLEKRRPVWRSK
jgi:methylglutaconyl-CoA hydratase